MSASDAKTVLVLGGGGVRGLAHLGILQVLQESGQRFDAIVGTSAGAIIGGMFALEPDARVVTKRVLGFLASSAFRRLKLRFDLDKRAGDGRISFFERFMHGLKRQLAMELLFRRPSIFKGEMLHILVRALVGEHRFEDAAIPLHITALDLRHGEQVQLARGPLVPAIVASSAVPGFFPPVPLDGRLLCDIGTINNMPIDVAREIGGTNVIAISLNSQVPLVDDLVSGIDVIFRAEEIGTKMFNDAKKAGADVVIEPNLDGRFWLDFSEPERVVEAGVVAARRALPQLLALGR